MKAISQSWWMCLVFIKQGSRKLNRVDKTKINKNEVSNQCNRYILILDSDNEIIFLAKYGKYYCQCICIDWYIFNRIYHNKN